MVYCPCVLPEPWTSFPWILKWAGGQAGELGRELNRPVGEGGGKIPQQVWRAAWAHQLPRHRPALPKGPTRWPFQVPRIPVHHAPRLSALPGGQAADAPGGPGLAGPLG